MFTSTKPFSLKIFFICQKIHAMIKSAHTYLAVEEMPLKKVKTNALRLLSEKGVAYTMHTYSLKIPDLTPEMLAKEIQRPVHLIYKTLVTKGHSGAHYVFCLPLQEELDLKKAAQACHEKSVSLVDLKELPKLTGYERGGVSPMAMKKPFRTFLDKGAENLPTIILSAGKRGYQMEVSPRELLSILPMTFTDLLASTQGIF